MKKDYLIIGQGIAGSLLAIELLKRGATVDIINKTDRQSSSYVAAGLYNPITGRKMVKTWNADKVFPLLEPYYSELEQQMKARFLFPTKIYRPFLAMEEQNEWQGRIADGDYHTMIEELKTG
ncbi:MAG: FAD-dependent oxidoreductase, partial [Bacteroidota bacterium]